MARIARLYRGYSVPTRERPEGGSSPAELIRALGVLRRPQTKTDLDGLERAYARPDTIVIAPTRYPYEMDRRLARVVSIPARRAEVLIAPIRFESSPTSGGPEGVLLSGRWAGDRFPLPGGLIGHRLRAWVSCLPMVSGVAPWCPD